MTGPPAPHVPILYLQAGAGTFFTIKCQEALLQAKFDPDWFASYEDVNRRIDTAKFNVKRWRTMTEAERRANPGMRPSPQDLFLSQCTAGHATHDEANRHRPGTGHPTDRGNPCASRVSGYLEEYAPAFPSEGASGVDGSVEDAQSRSERRGQNSMVAQNRADIAAGRASPGTLNDYPATDANPARHSRERHEDERGRQLAQQHGGRVRAGVEAGAAEAGMPPPAPGADGVTPKGPTEPTVDRSKQVDGETAEDCINEWRRRALEAMKTEGVKQEITRYEQARANEADLHRQRNAILAPDASGRTEVDRIRERGRAASRAQREAEDRNDSAGAAAAQLEGERASLAATELQRRLTPVERDLRRARNYDQHMPCLEAMRDTPPGHGTVGTAQQAPEPGTSANPRSPSPPRRSRRGR